MADTAQNIRRQIALYRRYLADGVAGDVALKYLIEIRKLESELAQIEVDTDKRP